MLPFLGKALGAVGKGLGWLGGGSAAAKGLGTAVQAASPFLLKGPGPKAQSYGSLMGAFKAADEAGLHRLSVAGSPAGYTPAPSAAAEGLMSAGRSMAAQPNSKKQSQLLDAQIAEARSRTVLNQANARRALSGPQPGLGQAGNAVAEAFDRLADSGPRRISREPERDMPATQTVTLGDFTGRGPNPEAFEVGVSELLAGGLIYGPQWISSALKDAVENATPARGRRRGSGGYRPRPRAPLPLPAGSSNRRIRR